METINNLASAATKAVWGESNTTQEPISGQTGDTSKGEPYDAGNIEDPKAQAAKAETTTGETTTTPGTSTTTNTSTTHTNGASDHTKDAEFSKATGRAAEADDAPQNPSADLKAKSAPRDTSGAQNDVRDPEDPATHPKAAPTDVNDAEDGPNEAQNLDGPGPKPIEEVAREHGGDAGKIEGGAAADGSGSKEAPKEDEDEGGPGAKSKGEGTGEQYVKTSGLKADGGDFDATKPGAGREADRLMEEKGMHGASKVSDLQQENSAETSGSGDKDKKDKKSIGQKLKDKLHRH
ncbi:hypothetical protein F4821DRAFT_226003 [Hypoxylon rubiginosum]|uniref:Uncharacterized protein n=1 Tax=Hypoxylon rubiginosum TaxID=110542 RepID=A0ACC0DHU9_9PEZI|nr:hypothetical protein F4821DRAFT_226003 [Hypoxylon rubiginosum]